VLSYHSRYTLSDAIAVSVFLNAFIRQSSSVGMANIAQSVNVISPLMTTKDGVVKQATWWPLLLFSKYMRGHTIALNVRSPEYIGRTNPEWIRGTIETPFLDCSAAIDDDGWVTLAVVNVSEESDHTVKLSGVANGEVSVFTVGASSVDAVNTGAEQRVKVEESKWSGGGEFLFRKHSLTMLRWKV
jgi:alpha-N-arabinofuranosidase